MLSLFSASTRAQARTFLAALLVLAWGIWTAPHLGGQTAVAVAVLIGVIALIVRTIQAWQPSFSFVKYLGHPYGDWADSFLQGFLGSLAVTLTGAFYAPDLHTARAFLTSALIGAFNAGVRAVQGALTKGEAPAAQLGLAEPAMPYTYHAPVAPSDAPG